MPRYEISTGHFLVQGLGYGKIKMGGITGNWKTRVGVGDGLMGKIGKGKMKPSVEVGTGATTTGVLVAVAVGGITGVGGAAMDASVLGMQAAEVMLPAIHPCPPSPPAKSMYHQVPSKFLPATLALPPCGMKPITPYTCPGPLRTFASVVVVIVGVQATSVAVGVEVGVDVEVAVSLASGVAVAVGVPPGRLQASIASVINKSAKEMFLFFIDKVLLQENMPALYGFSSKIQLHRLSHNVISIFTRTRTRASAFAKAHIDFVF